MFHYFEFNGKTYFRDLDSTSYYLWEEGVATKVKATAELAEAFRLDYFGKH